MEDRARKVVLKAKLQAEKEQREKAAEAVQLEGGPARRQSFKDFIAGSLDIDARAEY